MTAKSDLIDKFAQFTACLMFCFSVSCFSTEQLRDHRGNIFSMKNLEGKIVLMVVGFTNCKDICPIEMARVTVALKQMKSSLGSLTPIFLTVDPENDTPKVIAKYLEHFHPSFTGITGDPSTIAKLVKEYGVEPRKKNHHGNDLEIDHGYSTFILNETGKIEVAVLPGLPPSHLVELLLKMTT